VTTTASLSCLHLLARPIWDAIIEAEDQPTESDAVLSDNAFGGDAVAHALYDDHLGEVAPALRAFGMVTNFFSLTTLFEHQRVSADAATILSSTLRRWRSICSALASIGAAAQPFKRGSIVGRGDPSASR
jgi:hypothetical protein